MCWRNGGPPERRPPVLFWQRCAESAVPSRPFKAANEVWAVHPVLCLFLLQDCRPAPPDHGPADQVQAGLPGSGERCLEGRPRDVPLRLGHQTPGARSEQPGEVCEEARGVGHLVHHRKGERKVNGPVKSSSPSEVGSQTRVTRRSASWAARARFRSACSMRAWTSTQTMRGVGDDQMRGGGRS